MGTASTMNIEIRAKTIFFEINNERKDRVVVKDISLN
jgi:hypothetical protein